MKLIKEAIVDILFVIIAEFVALILLGTFVYVKIISPEDFKEYQAFYMSGIYLFTGLFLIRKSLPVNGIKRYLVFLCSFVAGHLTNILIFKEKFNLKTVSLLVLFAFCGLVGILVREIPFPAKKYAITVLILISSLLVLTPLLPLLQNVRHEKTLIDYIKNDETEKAKNAIENGADVNQTDETGATPAMWAAYNGNIELLDLLVKNGADANRSGILNVNSERFGTVYTNAINAAAGEGHLEAVKYLIEKAGVSSNTVGRAIRDFFLSEEDVSDPDGLCRFMQNSDDPISKNIRKRGSLPIFGCNDGGLTDKNRSIFRSSIAVLFSEMIKSVVIEKNNRLIKTPVQNIKDVAENRFFIDKTFGKYIKTLRNYTFFDGNKKGATPLNKAVSTAKKEVVVYLLEKNADPNFQNENGITALHEALFNVHYDIVKILLENGARADLYSEIKDDGFRVYPGFLIVSKCVPSEMNREEYNRQIKTIVPLMFKAGAKAEHFVYPASRFCQCKNHELVEFLVSYGVDPDFKFDDFITLKEICADNGVEIKDEWLKKKEQE